MKNVLITGTSSGFGNLAAKTLSSNGFKVWASMRNTQSKNSAKKADLENFAREEQVSLNVIELDVTDQQSVDRAVQTILEEDGKIDILINNAGSMYVGITEAYSLEQVQQQFDVNFFGLIRTTKTVLPHMRKQEDGLLINTTSLAGRLSFPYFGIYCASKFAVEAYSQSLRYELAPFGIEVSIVEPGPFGTNLLYSGPEESDTHILDQYGESKDIPQAMLKNFEQFYETDNAVPPQVVAEAYLNLIETPKGERPIRTVTGIDYGTLRYNELTQPIQDALVKDSLGMEHLLSIKSV